MSEVLKVKIHFEDGTKYVKNERRSKEAILESFRIGSYMSVGYGEKGMRVIEKVEIIE